MIFGVISALVLSVAGCDCYHSPEINQGLDEVQDKFLYVDQYDPISDRGQYYLPQMTVKPQRFWSCVEVLGVGSRNDVNPSEQARHRGLQYHLLCQSLAGLNNRAVEEGRIANAIWLHDHEGRDSYKLSRQALIDMGISEIGMQSGLELAENHYSEGDPSSVIDGYVLTDLRNNIESGVVAAVASHVYNAIIIDKQYESEYTDTYKLLYDASGKTTEDAWKEFKDKCSNGGLVIMPANTGELREMAIKNGYFVLNLLKEPGNPDGGKNTGLLKEVLAWLAPGAPVYGWEQGVGEDEFVNPISMSGHPMIPCDWSYNHTLTSLVYAQRQEPVLAKVVNPQFIDYGKKKNYVSFFLSDGDNIQWMMNDFKNSFYTVPEAEEVKMTFGMPMSVLPMLAPAQFDNLMSAQNKNCSVMEMLGGGYYYVDNFGQGANRAECLERAATRLAGHMRQHRTKILGVMAKDDVTSAAAMEAYQAYVDANDQLEGIVALQYSPYAAGKGEIMWVTNKAGYDIPVITARYSIWNFGDRNAEREGSPAYIAGRLNDEAAEESFSAICVHAWSNFSDTGSDDPVAENKGGDLNGAKAAKLCLGHLDDRFEAVNMQELVWRIRMSERPEQTTRYLSIYF